MDSGASFPVVLGDFGCDVTCQACRQNSPWFQTSSGNSDSANWPEYEAVDYVFQVLDSGRFETIPIVSGLRSGFQTPGFYIHKQKFPELYNKKIYRISDSLHGPKKYTDGSAM